MDRWFGNAGNIRRPKFLKQSEIVHIKDMLRVVSRSIVSRTSRVSVESVLPKACASYHNNFSKQTISKFHNTSRVENELIVGGLAVGAAAVTIKYALMGYESLAAKKAEKAAEQPNSDNAQEATNNATGSEKTQEEEQPTMETNDAEAEQAKKKADAKKRAQAKSTNMDSWFGNMNNWFAKNFYDGGFEDKMNKREAALILGVRENAAPERVKEAHRRIMQINHPDKGGSAYLTAKVNEAKDLLLKGK